MTDYAVRKGIFLDPNAEGKIWCGM